MSKEEQVSHKQMRILRLRFDQLNKEYKAIDRVLYKKELEEYLEKLKRLVDRACNNSGFGSQPVYVDRNIGRRVREEDIRNKGRVARR
jgi:hypothetical protein